MCARRARCRNLLTKKTLPKHERNCSPKQCSPFLKQTPGGVVVQMLIQPCFNLPRIQASSAARPRAHNLFLFPNNSMSPNGVLGRKEGQSGRSRSRMPAEIQGRRGSHMADLLRAVKAQHHPGVDVVVHLLAYHSHRRRRILSPIDTPVKHCPSQFVLVLLRTTRNLRNRN